ncbi:helix-turn-helix domain-containing protein [Maribellus maritimus]|uniref:helix-turn-helix domain-containing protein n=1 Tax=Maribellus maritimus TaxID=2870838 RepID=UPI001EEA3837|nr:helix-turn-helix domain-containing protein [Maribellus maritimus]MCG6186289.1 helix-turn-helix domain-containing protein [Maribellus maritimus]
MENSELPKRVRDFRIKKGLSQEELANKTGLSLRTIQRIENGESIPRGDTFKKIAIALQVSPEEIIDWQIQEDDNIITLLNLSQLGFIFFPWIGIIVPMIIWINQKDKIKNVDSIGKVILNYQISWNILLFGMLIASFIISPLIVIIWYLYNFILVIINTRRYIKKKQVIYKPTFKILQ